MAHAKRQKGTRGTAEDGDTADTVSVDESGLIETAEFKALVELDDELFGEDDPPSERGPAVPNERSGEEDAPDPFAITDKFEAVPDGDENPGFDPYNNSEES